MPTTGGCYSEPNRKKVGGDVQPKVSVIVPIYNLEPYLDRCLSSLVAQDYQALELILVDDCSTDGSRDVIARYAARDARIHALYQPVNGGVSAARNAALAVATGTYVGFADGDDWLAPHAVAALVAALEAGPYDLVTSPFYLDDGKKSQLAPRHLQDRPLTRKQFINGMLAPAGQVRGYLWNKIFRRSVIEAAHLRFDESLALMEDELFCVEYAVQTDRFFYRGKPGYHHVIRADSATRTYGLVGSLPQQLTVLHRINQTLRAAKGQAPAQQQD
ncbi:glycosyltransferase family A protein [Lacticaseibacillus parakribbianus]|uniref:glycosyltransferase family 2 protein n=1 Tax=Lacticaseibacillus parakribbianus TaxID=2970927 RepID=UPI0030B8531E